MKRLCHGQIGYAWVDHHGWVGVVDQTHERKPALPCHVGFVLEPVQFLSHLGRCSFSKTR